MPRNGSGTASKAVVDFVTGNTISATDMNTLIDDIISMLTDSVSKDGQTVITGTLDFNGNRIILDVDADTSITADSDDQIDFEVGGSDVVRFNTVGVVSVPTAGITAGTTQTQGGATALTKGINEVSTCANSEDGVKLPTAVAGQKVTIINNGAEDLKIWPNTSDRIKGGSADAADPDTLRSGRSRTYVAIDAENWYLSVDDTISQLGRNLDGQDYTVSKIKLKDYGEVTNAIGSIGGGTQDIDLTLGNSVSATVDTSSTTFTFSNPTASDELCGFILYLTNGGSQTVTWPASVDWPAATAPTLTASGIDILVFTTIDGGTTWYGNVVGQAYA